MELNRKFFLLTSLFIALPLISAAQQAPMAKQPEELPLIEATKDELLQFWGWVMHHVEIGTENSKYLPPQTSKRLLWLVDSLQKKELSFDLATGRVPPIKQLVIMVADYRDGKPIILVNLSQLAIWYWESYKSKTPISRQERNTLTLALSHEIIHLQHGPLVLAAVKSDPQLRDFEERRTWATFAIEDIRPLAEQGEPLNEDFVQTDKTLRSCQDDMDCPAFKKLISDHLPK